MKKLLNMQFWATLSSWIWFERTFQLVFPFNDFLAVWHINLRMHFSWCTFPKFQGSLNKLSFISNSLWISSANSPLKQQQEMQPALKCLIFNPIYPKKKQAECFSITATTKYCRQLCVCRLRDVGRGRE